MKENWQIIEITFSDILPLWQKQLWPHRTSKIETHSAMTWPWSSGSDIDMSIFDREVIYWGAYYNQVLVGVNSGHGVSDTEYRSRGLWVQPEWRRNGIGLELLNHTCEHALDRDYAMIWSLPRVKSLNAYNQAGFQEVGEHFSTETSDLNVYVKRYL
jgi:GNAT superfamily N-acetyltransferase